MNQAHMHKDETGAEVEAFGLRDHCDLCRARAGKAPISEVERKLAVLAGGTKATGTGTIPADDALRMLEEQEEVNDALRARVVELEAENAQLRAGAKKSRGGE